MYRNKSYHYRSRSVHSHIWIDRIRERLHVVLWTLLQVACSLCVKSEQSFYAHRLNIIGHDAIHKCLLRCSSDVNNFISRITHLIGNVGTIGSRTIISPSLENRIRNHYSFELHWILFSWFMSRGWMAPCNVCVYGRTVVLWLHRILRNNQLWRKNAKSTEW